MSADRVLLTLGFALFWVAMVALMYWGWRGRAKRQQDRIGQLPAVPEHLGA